MGLTLLFIIGQTVFLMRYMEQDDPENPATEDEASSKSADSQT